MQQSLIDLKRSIVNPRFPAFSVCNAPRRCLLMNNKRRFLCFLLLVSFLLSAHLPSARAFSYSPQWEHVQRELDCQGQKIVIDAITDINLPETVCEYNASQRIMTEEKLRAFVAVAAPGYETMPLVRLQSPDGDDGWVLEDEEAGILATPGIPFCLERYLETGAQLSVGTTYDFSHFYKEPIDPQAVESLKELSYPETLKLLESVLTATELSLGEPRFVKVYDLDTFNSNQKQYNDTFHEHNNFTWQASDELYKLEYPVYFQGLPLHAQGGLVIGDKSTAYTSLNITLRADGTLLKLHVSSTIDNPVATSPEAKPLSLEQMLDIYVQFLSSIILPDYVEPRVCRISLEYLVWLDYTNTLPTYQLVPFWCFYLPYNDPVASEDYNYVQYFNAVTGEYLNID